jgi:acyl carrier protein
MTDPVNEKIRDLLVELQSSWRREDLTDDLSLIRSRVIDSLGLLHLIAALERDFAIEIRDEEIVPANFSTIADMEALIGRKRRSVAGDSRLVEGGAKTEDQR